MTIPRPTEVDDLAPLREALDATDHAARVAWTRSLGGRQLLKLYALAEGQLPVRVDELVRSDATVVPHIGKNGVPVFTFFQKKFARLGEEVVGFNDGSEAGPAFIRPIYRRITGPGHYVAYDSPDNDFEVWIDYRRVSEQQHPEFPPLMDNRHGTRALVFGNMVDVLRRVSQHVFIGDATRSLPPLAPLTLWERIATMSPTAPFALVQPD